MRFLIDAQLPPALSDWLEKRGHEAEHVYDALPANAPDAAIVARARDTGAALVSKDGDFLDLLDGPNAPQLVWMRIGNTSNPALFAMLEKVWARVEQELAAGRMVIEVG